jgi:hypothetical protein
VGYLASVSDLLKRVIAAWVLVVMAAVFAIGWLFDAFVRPNWQEAPPMLEAILPYSGWALLATIFLAITLAYHQMRSEKAAGSTNTYIYNGPTYNFPPGEEGIKLYKELGKVDTVISPEVMPSNGGAVVQDTVDLEDDGP